MTTGSLSASLTVNGRLVKLPCSHTPDCTLITPATLIADRVFVALNVVIVQLCHGPQSKPSKACTHSVSLPAEAPPTYVTVPRFTAFTVMFCCAGCAVPPTSKWPPPVPPSQNRYCVT